LRHLGGGEVAARLREQRAAEISFNYLGQFDQSFDDQALFIPAGENGGSPRSPRRRRAQALGIDGQIYGGRLRVVWSYSEKLHRRQTVESLAEGYIAALRGMIAHCQSPQAGELSPSDFPLGSFTQEELDAILKDLN
jgi:non-ribosomal peptide synthase protein (TIGR01720 family)